MDIKKRGYIRLWKYKRQMLKQKKSIPFSQVNKAFGNKKKGTSVKGVRIDYGKLV